MSTKKKETEAAQGKDEKRADIQARMETGKIEIMKVATPSTTFIKIGRAHV